MKHSHTFFLTTLIATSLGLAGLVNGQQHANAEAKAEAHAEASGSSQSSSQKKTVTVTSDGKRTIKKTVIENNGVRQTITEITDENGNTTTTREGGNGDAQDNGDVRDNGEARGPWLGVRVREVSRALRSQLGLPSDQGVLVDAVAPESPAAEAGIKEGDLMLTIDGESVATPEELEEILAGYEVGDMVEVEILRDGKRQTLEVTLAAQPENADQPGHPPADGGNQAGGAGNGGRIEVELEGGDFDAILQNPDVPNDFKKTVRDMQRRMKEFQDKHQKQTQEMEREMEEFRRKHQIQPAN